MRRIIRYLQSHLRQVAVGSGCLLGIASILLFRLGSLTVHLSQREHQQQLFSASWHHLTADPLNLPYTAVQWLFLTLFSSHSTTVTRLASVCFGALGLLAFGYVIRCWYGMRAAIFGTILYGTSSWFLHVSRFGTVDVLYLSAVPVMLATQLFWERHARHTWVSWVAIAVFGLLLYIPGMIWLLVLSFGLHPGQLLRSWQHTRKWWQWTGIGLIAALLLAPLVWAISRKPSLGQTWAGFPSHFATPTQFGHQLLHTISFLGYHGPNDPQLWLDRVPVFDVFTLAMLVLGGLFYVRHTLAGRTRQLLGLWLIGAVFYALNGPVAYSLLVPIAFLVVTAGIAYLLHEWLRVFPNNTLARTVGYGVLSFVIAVACLYNLRAYFIAWPHSLATISAYQIPGP